jgi:hypothetical protein
VITSLSATGLQDGDFTDMLSPVTIWTGANACGKTKRLSAIHLAARGEHPDPKIGSRNEGIMQLASGPMLHVEMEYRGPVSGRLVRTWTKTKTGYSCDNKEPCEDFPSLLLDPKEYFSLSPAKQIELVASKVSVSSTAFTVAGLTAAIKNLKLDDGANTESSEKALASVCDRLRDIKVDDGPLPWLEAALKQVSDDLKAANATKKRMVGVTTGLEQLRAQDTDAETGTGTVERDLRQEREKLAGLEREQGTLTGRANAADKARSRRKALEAVQTPAGVDEAALVAVRDELAAKISAITKSVQERPVTVMELRGTLASCQAKQGAATQNITALNQRIARLEAMKAPASGQQDDKEYLRLKNLVTDLEESVKSRKNTTDQDADAAAELGYQKAQAASAYIESKSQIAAVHAEIKKFMAMQCCPTCMADGTEWKTKWHLTQLEKVKVLESKMDAATVNGTRLKKELEIALAAMQKKRGADVDLIQHQAALAATEQRIAAIAREQQQFAASREELAQVKRERDQQQAQADFSAAKIKEIQPSFDVYVVQDFELTYLRVDHGNALAKLESAAASLKDFKAAQQELASMPVAESHETLAAEQDALTAKVTAAKQRISEFEARAREIAAFRGTLRSQMQAAAAATAVESEIAVLKAAGKLLQERQAALVEKAFKPLLAICNRFTSCVIPHELIYQDSKLGYMNKGTFVGSNTFNGAWSSVAYLGLATALCQDAKEKVVCFDELARLTSANKTKIVKRMLELLDAGIITQFLGNDLDGTSYRDISDKIKIISV